MTPVEVAAAPRPVRAASVALPAVEPEDREKVPTVTVAIPVRHEEGILADCLEAVLDQDYPPEAIEVLLVDGGVTPATRAVALAAAARDPRVRILENPAGLASTALNVALVTASGDFFVRVDGHAIVARDYVRRTVELLVESGAENVGGPMLPRGETPAGRAIAAAMRSRFGVGPARFRYAREVSAVDTVYLGSFPRALFARIGGFDETLARNQDYELNYRIRRAGGRILVDPGLRTTYLVRPDLGSLARQFWSYGYWKVQTLRRHPRSLRPRQIAAPALLAALVGAVAVASAALIAAPAAVAPLLLPAGLVALYALAALVAATASVRACGVPVALRLPAVFATMHFAWGLGFWWGWLRPPRPGPGERPAPRA